MQDDLGSFLRDFLEPWYISLENPVQSQAKTLETLIKEYSKTEYGRKFLSRGHSIDDFRTTFPIAKYEDLVPYIRRVGTGEQGVLFSEPVTGWVMTRGTTGIPKVIPITETHLSQVFTNGARAITNFALKTDPQVLAAKVLNLNFPSLVGEIHTQSGKMSYGYSSGTYAKLFPSFGETGLMPIQEDIDSLGSGISKRDWEERFELVYEKARGASIGSVMGVTPVILEFAYYLKKKHGLFPKDLWKMKALFCTSVAKIHSKYSPVLRHVYGDAPVVEMYSATEGVFGQQFDDLPYIRPNYDTYFFEVRTSREVKPLSELKQREWGSIVISSVLFPRYEIGDLVEALGKGCFRIFGRARKRTVLEHWLYNLIALRFV
ncbi:MAG: GH3 auxin-responsive promoter family protein [Nitrososphaerota archaeon]|nr:GH3 auxin-responsive promoter family protein [Nitrososphaerota archaeon]